MGDTRPLPFLFRRITMHLRKISWLCLLLLLFSVVADAKIVFSSNRDGVQGVYVMDDDGSNQIALIEEEDRVFPFPKCWSPDGKQIVFEQPWGIYLMHPDGTNIRKLLGGKDYIGKMSFSPDSKSLVFDMMVKKDGKVKCSVNVLNIETGELKEIADFYAIFCDWSPDGKQIVFTKQGLIGEGINTLWIMGSDGHQPRKLLPRPAEGKFKSARWSPDGKQIVYLHDQYVWERHEKFGPLLLIYKGHRYLICDRNGKNIKQLRVPKDWQPLQIDWMDDGKSVVFSAYVGLPLNELVLPDQYPPANIYKYHIPTGEITQLTDHPGRDGTLDWISDDVLPVSSVGKIKVMWGKIKQ